MRAAQYAVLALGLTWLVWVPAFLLLSEPPLPLIMLGAFGPAVAAAVLVRRGGGSLRGWLRDIVVVRVPARWYAFAVAVPLAVVVLQTAVAVLSGVPLAPEVLPARLLTFATSAVLVFFVGGGQEEPGWRGYLLPVLQSRVTPLVASLLIGVLWAVWHLPLFVFGFEQYAGGSFVIYLPTLLGLAVVFTFLWNRSGGSIVVVMVLHAVNNAASSLVPVAPDDVAALEDSLLPQLVAPTVFVALAVVLIGRHGSALGGAPAAPTGVVPRP